MDKPDKAMNEIMRKNNVRDTYGAISVQVYSWGIVKKNELVAPIYKEPLNNGEREIKGCLRMWVI